MSVSIKLLENLGYDLTRYHEHQKEEALNLCIADANAEQSSEEKAKKQRLVVVNNPEVRFVQLGMGGELMTEEQFRKKYERLYTNGIANLISIQYYTGEHITTFKAPNYKCICDYFLERWNWMNESSPWEKK